MLVNEIYKKLYINAFKEGYEGCRKVPDTETVTPVNSKEERYWRNPKLAAALTQYKWVRESNEGVGRIFQEMNEYFLVDPVYEEPNGSGVQLTLKNNILGVRREPS